MSNRRETRPPHKVVLVRATLHDKPGAVTYWLTTQALAERWAADIGAEHSGDRIEILGRNSFAVAASVPDSAVLKAGGRSGMHYLGTQVGAVWVPSGSTAQAQRRN